MTDENENEIETTPTYDAFCKLVKTELKYYAEAIEMEVTKNDLEIMCENVLDLIAGPVIQLLENAVSNEFETLLADEEDDDDGDDPDPSDGIIDADFTEHGDDDQREAA
jgi:hypothetical protein